MREDLYYFRKLSFRNRFSRKKLIIFPPIYMNKKQITHWLKVAVVGIALGFGLQFVRAWTEPTATPPDGNVGAPINTGTVDQTKGDTSSGKINAKDFCLNGGDSTKCLSAVVGAPAPAPPAPAPPAPPAPPPTATHCNSGVYSCGSTYEDNPSCSFISGICGCTSTTYVCSCVSGNCGINCPFVIQSIYTDTAHCLYYP